MKGSFVQDALINLQILVPDVSSDEWPCIESQKYKAVTLKNGKQ